MLPFLCVHKMNWLISNTHSSTEEHSIPSQNSLIAQLIKNPPAMQDPDPGLIPGLGRSTGEGIRLPIPVFLGFPYDSAGKESASNVGDLGSIPGLGRSPGEGIDYPLQYSWASLVAQLVKNPAALQETWV